MYQIQALQLLPAITELDSNSNVESGKKDPPEISAVSNVSGTVPEAGGERDVPGHGRNSLQVQGGRTGIGTGAGMNVVFPAMTSVYREGKSLEVTDTCNDTDGSMAGLVFQQQRLMRPVVTAARTGGDKVGQTEMMSGDLEDSIAVHS